MMNVWAYVRRKWWYLLIVALLVSMNLLFWWRWFVTCLIFAGLLWLVSRLWLMFLRFLDLERPEE